MPTPPTFILTQFELTMQDNVTQFPLGYTSYQLYDNNRRNNAVCRFLVFAKHFFVNRKSRITLINLKNREPTMQEIRKLTIHTTDKQFYYFVSRAVIGVPLLIVYVKSRQHVA